MALRATQELQDKLKAHFDCIEGWHQDPELGFRSMPVSGLFIATAGFDPFISRVKSVLPSDVKLILFDSSPMWMSYPDGMYLLIFGSKTWPRGAEGDIIPRFEPLILGEATGNPVYDLKTFYIPEGVECRLIVNKNTHTLTIRPGEETEDRCVVAVTPKA